MSILSRMFRFYRAFESECESTKSFIWNVVSGGAQKQFINCLKSGNEQDLYSEFQKFFVSGKEICSAVGVCPTSWGSLELLARKAGILPFPNPEQPSPTNNSTLSNIEMVKRSLESELSISLDVPVAFSHDPLGSSTRQHFFYHCAVSCAAKQMMHDFPPNHVLEIGGGIGNIAVIIYRWKASSYTLIDLPSVAVMGAFALSKECDEAKIRFLGEPKSDDEFARILPSSSYSEAQDRKYDIVFNSDSFPEITEAHQDLYIRLIANSLSKCGIFVSVNHESDIVGQHRTIDAVKRNPGLKLVSRSPFIMRPGYVEEIYSLQ